MKILFIIFVLIVTFIFLYFGLRFLFLYLFETEGVYNTKKNFQITKIYQYKPGKYKIYGIYYPKGFKDYSIAPEIKKFKFKNFEFCYKGNTKEDINKFKNCIFDSNKFNIVVHPRFY